MALPPNNRKGTGYTNINRVLTANQGNRLGENVVSGVQNQANQIKQNVQSSQQKFQEEAQKNRLDTEENSKKVDGIIGRFDTASPVAGTQAVANQTAASQQSGVKTAQAGGGGTNDGLAQAPSGTPNLGKQPKPTVAPAPQNAPAPQSGINPINDPNSRYYVDEAGFKLSNTAQSEYDQKRQAILDQQTKYQQELAGQRQTINDRITADSALLKSFQDQMALQSNPANRASGSGNIDLAWGIEKAIASGNAERYNASVSALQNALAALDESGSGQVAGYNDQIKSLDEQLAGLTKNEKDAWIASERDKLIAANMPTEQEIGDFTKYRAGVYSGPKELGDIQSLLGNATDTEQMGALTRSDGGRQELLKRIVGGNGYTYGQQKLDSLLLSQSGDALNQARSATRGLTNQVSDANMSASNLGNEFVNRAKIFGQDVTKRLGDARNPVNTKIDEQLKAIQAKETGNTSKIGNIQNIFGGTDENTKNMDRIARLGIGLQAAKDAGYLTDAQANQLLGDGGLIQRAEALGLDTSGLLNERLSSVAAQNVNRGGAASAAQEAQLTALDRLLGKTGTDLEFGTAGADYQAGRGQFNLDSLKDYVTKSEAERQQSGAVQIDSEKLNKRYMDLAAEGVQGMAQGGMQAAGGALNGALNPKSYYDPATQIGNAADIAQGGTTAATGAARTLVNKDNALLEGLAKLNIGGKSIADTEGGKQLLNALRLKSKAEEGVLKGASGGLGSVIGSGKDSLTDLAKGDVSGALTSYLNAPVDAIKAAGLGDVANAAGNALNRVGSGFGAGSTGNWATHELGTIDAVTGKGVQVGSYANKSSKEIMNQILSQSQLLRTNSRGNAGYEGANQMNLLLAYYKNALAREKGNK